MAVMTNLRLVSQNIRSCRLRAFALPGLRANAANSFLGCLSHVDITHLNIFLFLFYLPALRGCVCDYTCFDAY